MTNTADTAETPEVRVGSHVTITRQGKFRLGFVERIFTGGSGTRYAKVRYTLDNGRSAVASLPIR